MDKKDACVVTYFGDGGSSEVNTNLYICGVPAEVEELGIYNCINLSCSIYVRFILSWMLLFETSL